jgi:transcription antitermination factor NusG
MYTQNNPHKLLARYKHLEQGMLNEYKWYVASVGNMQHIFKLEYALRDTDDMAYRIWAPCYKEYRKYHSDFILADRLLYSGYIFIGLKNEDDFCKADTRIATSRLGYMLGNSKTYLHQEDLNNVYAMYLKFQDCKKMMYNVQEGDNISLKSGPFSGLCGVVQNVYSDGRVRIKAYFMQRELEINISVLDVQVLSAGNFYEESDLA